MRISTGLRLSGKYYLYFAHHQGDFIRLAYADQVTGPYRVHSPGVLTLAESGFPKAPLQLAKITSEGILGYIKRFGSEKILPFFPPHVASPDVHIHPESEEIWMYYHGQTASGVQLTKVAKSKDGLNFKPEPGFLGSSYFRDFTHQETYYALSHAGGVINRSQDGLVFEAGPVIGDPNMSHTAIRRKNAHELEVYWSRYKDAPEHILVSDLKVSDEWTKWRISNTRSVRKPEFDWEGASIDVKPPQVGFSRGQTHESRDPGIFEEDGRCYLLYSVKGKSGIRDM